MSQQVNNWFRNVKEVVMSSAENRVTYLFIFGLLYFGIKDYNSSTESEKVITHWKEIAKFERTRANKWESKYEDRIDYDIEKAERQEIFLDTVRSLLNKKLPKNDNSSN